jgi:hypothetical protein
MPSIWTLVMPVLRVTLAIKTFIDIDRSTGGT